MALRGRPDPDSVVGELLPMARPENEEVLDSGRQFVAGLTALDRLGVLAYHFADENRLAIAQGSHSDSGDGCARSASVHKTKGQRQWFTL